MSAAVVFVCSGDFLTVDLMQNVAGERRLILQNQSWSWLERVVLSRVASWKAFKGAVASKPPKFSGSALGKAPFLDYLYTRRDKAIHGLTQSSAALENAAR